MPPLWEFPVAYDDGTVVALAPSDENSLVKFTVRPSHQGRRTGLSRIGGGEYRCVVT